MQALGQGTYRNNGILEEVCVHSTDAAVRVRTHVLRVRTACHSAILTVLQMLRSIAIDVFCIFATSSGVRALTSLTHCLCGAGREGVAPLRI